MYVSMNVSHRRVDYTHVEDGQQKLSKGRYESVCGCGVIAPLIPNFGARSEWSALRYALNSKWDGHQSRSERFGENSLAPAQYLTTSHRMSGPPRTPVATKNTTS
jgi:hypothetical protein